MSQDPDGVKSQAAVDWVKAVCSVLYESDWSKDASGSHYICFKSKNLLVFMSLVWNKRFKY